MSATAIRGKDWVFNAFWAACGESSANRCSINIPITFIFKHGKPVKSLTTDLRTGYIKRVSLDDVIIERTEGERGFRGEAFKTLRAVRQLLLEYSADHGYDNSQNTEEPVLCKVL